MKNYTLLSKEEILGVSKLEIIKKMGICCEATDFAKVLGGYTEKDEKNSSWFIIDPYFDGDELTEEMILNNPDLEVDPIIVNATGNLSCVYASNRIEGIRPVIKFDELGEMPKNGRKNKFWVLEVEYGEFPQNVVDVNIAKVLNNEYQKGNLVKTGKTYSTDSVDYDQYDSEEFTLAEHEEYEYKGKKYVRVKVRNLNETTILSNGFEYKPGDIVWLEVKPITWYVDEKEKLLLSKNSLVSGIRFCEDGKYFYGFEETEVSQYLNTYFASDILSKQEQMKAKQERKELIKRIRDRKNPYQLELSEVSEEEIIRIAVESDLAVFLHGPSSEGKSARVKAIDPDCIVIYLRNATPESLNGKSAYNSETHEMIDIKPSWLKKLEAKCEAEPDKLHIVFFDEITNALPSIQGMAFNIILDKEVNGIWQLPKNARIVAAGNETKDSLSANQLSEPLFNRFAHVYIKTTVDGWLKWASEKNIHPAIYAYIASTKGKPLRTEYNGETPNADPRKWEMSSKMLYATSKPEALRSLLGEEVTQEFIAFCKQPVLTIKDVLEDNYDKRDLNILDISEKYATVYGLSQVKEEHLDEVRSFVTKLGAEATQLFDTLWVHNDAKRLERLAEARLANEQEKKIKIKK